ncbi:MAG: ribosomal RNA small subunit methyltransferase A [Saprospiraceae bacterium]|nr:ribosomal RNA small subunit methyltransferase A [Saprospiraceae bacterium]
MGQHFLHRMDIANAIVDACDCKVTQNRLLEIGPGPGILTSLLLEKGLDLKCVELDYDMIDILRKKFPSLGSALIQGDILRINFNELFGGRDFNVIGNFPYNISSQIVFQIIQYRELVPLMIGMFQKEMAERIIAAPGSKAYGVISVLTQAWYEGYHVIHVPPTAFDPPPKVDSLVIGLKRRQDDNGIRDYKSFTKIVKNSFSMRRKMLRNNLKNIFQDTSILSKPIFNKRAEQLSLKDYVELTELYLSQLKQNI